MQGLSYAIASTLRGTFQIVWFKKPRFPDPYSKMAAIRDLLWETTFRRGNSNLHVSITTISLSDTRVFLKQKKQKKACDLLLEGGSTVHVSCQKDLCLNAVRSVLIIFTDYWLKGSIHEEKRIEKRNKSMCEKTYSTTA